MSLSHVAIEQNICPVCGRSFDTGNLLLDKRLKESLHSEETTGYSLCPEHEELYEQGYMALVGIDESQSTKSSDGYSLKDIYRIGQVIHIRKEIFHEVFTMVDVDIDSPLIFINQATIDHFKSMLEALNEDTTFH